MCVPTTVWHCTGHGLGTIARPSMCVLQKLCRVVRKTTDSQVRLHRVQISAPTLFVLCSRLMLLRLNFSSIKGGNNNTLLGR